MSQLLRLEYACTKAEMEQAQSLILRKQLGGGSKWRTWLVLLVLLGGVLLGFYFQVRHDVPRTCRPFIFPVMLGLIVVLALWKYKSRGGPPATTRVEVSATDFTILGPDSKVTMPWSAFGECLESPDLFVLLDRPRAALMVAQTGVSERKLANLVSRAGRPSVELGGTVNAATSDGAIRVRRSGHLQSPIGFPGLSRSHSGFVAHVGAIPCRGGADGRHDSLPACQSSAGCCQFSHQGILHVRV